MAEGCLFCRIASGEIPSAKVAETETAFAFRDIDPKAPTHVLVIPRKHVASLSAVSDPAMFGDLLSLAASVARSEGLEENGYRVVINNGHDGGQTVDHLHLHVLGGRRLIWPPG
jgi:histidine triad (HIT) family protein